VEVRFGGRDLNRQRRQCARRQIHAAFSQPRCVENGERIGSRRQQIVAAEDQVMGKIIPFAPQRIRPPVGGSPNGKSARRQAEERLLDGKLSGRAPLAADGIKRGIFQRPQILRPDQFLGHRDGLKPSPLLREVAARDATEDVLQGV